MNCYGILVTLCWAIYGVACIGGQAIDKPCSMNDIQCLKDNLQKFLDRTAGGIAAIGLLPIDPIYVEHLEVEIPDGKGMIHFHNSSITGLKNMQIEMFQMNQTDKRVTFTVKMECTFASNASYRTQRKKETAPRPGYFKDDLSMVANVSYPYDISKDSNEIEHYEVGQETFTFKLTEEPKAISNFIEDHKSPDLSCKLAAVVINSTLPVFVQNIRQTAKILPMTSFFTTD